MPTIQDRLERLVGKKRGKGRLPPAPTRGAIPKDRTVTYPSRDSTGGDGSIASPLTEQGTAPTEYYQMTSSDGFVVFEYGRESYYTDANGKPVQVINLDRWG